MTIPEIDAPHLSDSRPVDLLVIGAGMAGLSIAYEALLKGREVTIVDRGPIACGMTARTTAHLASALDDRYFNFIALRGESEATLLRESLMLSIDRIEQIAKDEKIDCDFARCDGYLFLGEGCNPDILEKEFEACRKIGLDVEWAEQAPMPRVDLGSCLRFPNQARFHPLKYLQGLAHGIQRLGGKFHASSAVENVAQSAAGVAVSCNGQTVMAQDVAVATNAPIAGWPTLHAKMAPYRSYAIAFAAPRGAVADALYWDTLDAYHYVRIQPGDDADHVIVGGAITRPVRRMMRRHASQRSRHGAAHISASLARSRIAGRGRCSSRWIMPALSDVTHGTITSISSPAIPAKASRTVR
jgi:hypothetical protein